MLSPDDPLSPSDPLWKSLEQASSLEPRPSFASDTLRLARLQASPPPKRWVRWLSPLYDSVPRRVCSAALVAGVLFWGLASFWTGDSTSPAPSSLSLISAEAGSEVQFREEEAWLEAALLTAALDSPELFSDEELVALLF